MGSKSITSAERIRELSEINGDVANLLASAGQAINALTNRSLDSTTKGTDDAQMVDDGSNTVESHKEQFTEQTNAYYTGIQAVIARLRRQAYALEEAGIITAEAPSLSTTASRSIAPTTTQGQNPSASQQQAHTESITNGGLGNFDVGWLNSRGNRMGTEKEADLLAEAKDLLHKMLPQSEGKT